jgi:hypothetical protein
MAYTFDDEDPFAGMYGAPAPAAPAQPQVLPNAAPAPGQGWVDPDRPDFDPGISSDATQGYGELPQVADEPLPSLEDAGRDSIRKRSAAADKALAAQETPAEELAAMRAQGGRQQFNEAFDAAGRRIRVTSPNREYPSWTKYAGTMQGDGSVSQAIGPDGQPVFQTQVVDELILGADGKPMPDPMNPQGPPLTRKVEKQVPVLVRNDGLIGQGRDAQVSVQAAELDREMEQTNLLAQQAMMQKQLHNNMLTSQMAQRQRTEEVRKTVDEAYKGVQKATAEFAKASDIDPDRGWGEKGVGAKIAAVIASGLLGFAGRDPFAHINAVIENSIDAQKANLAKRQAAVGEARGQQAAAVSAYDQIRAQVGDEALADDAYRLSALETIKSQALAKLQNANVTVRSAQADAFINGLDQQIAEVNRAIELKSATTPATITRSVSPYTPAQQAMIKTMGIEGLKAANSGADKAIDIVAGRQTQQRDTQGKVDIERAKREFGDEIGEGDAKLLLAHSDNVKYAKAVIDQVDRIMADYGGKDLPGRGVSSVTDWAFAPNERSQFNAKVKDATDTFGRLVSGAAIKDDEMERFLESARAGVGDEALSQNLRDMQQKAVDILQNSERALPERLRAHFRRVDRGALPGLEADMTGASGRVNRPGGEGGVVQVDE